MKLGNLFKSALATPLKAMMPKNPWLRVLIIAIPILLLMALFKPLFELLSDGLKVVFGLFAPFLENATGRLLLLNLLLGLALVFSFYLFRGRFRQLRSGLQLRRLQDGIMALALGQDHRAADLLRKVALYAGPLPSEYPHVVSDARLKLARLALSKSDYNRSLSWLTPIREHSLPKELRRSLLQLKVDTYLLQGEVLPETVQSELDSSLAQFPDDLRMLKQRRQIHLEQGDLLAAAKIQEQICKHAPKARQAVARHRWLLDLVVAGTRALEGGELDQALSLAKRAHKVDADHPEPICLLGKVHQAKGDARRAIKEWGRSRSPEGLRLIGSLLDDFPGVLSPRELLECCPSQGGLLLVSRELARTGETQKALRAARRAARHLELTPQVASILGEVMTLCGEPEEARKLSDQAFQRLLSPPEK